MTIYAVPTPPTDPVDEGIVIPITPEDTNTEK
jgi:hypothetical protein